MAEIDALPFSFTFKPQTMALVVIDMQRDFAEPGGFGASLGNDVSRVVAIVPTVKRLIEGFRAAGLPVIHTMECHRADLSDLPPAKRNRGNPSIRIGDVGPMGRVLIVGEPGTAILDELAPLPGEIVIEKPGKGAFYATSFGEDLKRLGAWFGNPDSAVSSHVANDEQGHDARYVRDGRKAWTEVAFNSVSLSIEQIGTDEYSRGTWLTQRAAQLRNTAEWIAHWHRRWGIPISRAKVSGSTVVRPGVTTHAALGSAGGGHDDPGPGYPFGHVLVLARSLATD